MLLRVLLKQLAPLFFWLAYRAFRSRYFRDSPRIRRWALNSFRLAADLGNRRALSVYGHLLFLRGDTEQSRIQGGIYLERAAEQGDSKAQYQMGQIYEQGFAHYFRIDPEKALARYRAAAAQGHSLAINRLHEVYSHGDLGVAADHDQARYWQEQPVDSV